jgi:hypothetical protein
MAEQLPGGLTLDEFERVVQAMALNPDETFDILTDSFDVDTAVEIASEAMVVLSDVGPEIAVEEARDDFEDGMGLDEIARVYGADVAQMVEQHELVEAQQALGDHLDEVGEVMKAQGFAWEPDDQGLYLAHLEAHDGDVTAAVEGYVEQLSEAATNAGVEQAVEARLEREERVMDELAEIEAKNPSRDSLDAALNEFVAEQKVDNARGPTKHADTMDDALDDLTTVLKIQKDSHEAGEAMGHRGFSAAERVQLAQESFDRLGELKEAYAPRAGDTAQSVYVEKVGDGKTDAQRIAEHRARSREEQASRTGART